MKHSVFQLFEETRTVSRVTHSRIAIRRLTLNDCSLDYTLNGKQSTRAMEFYKDRKDPRLDPPIFFGSFKRACI